MNEARSLQTLPVSMGCIENGRCTTFWVSLPVVQRHVSPGAARRSAYRRAKKRHQILNAALDGCYKLITCGCCIGMVGLLIRMMEIM